jgi:arsenate reductase
VNAHWGLPDPAAVEGSDAEKAVAFAETYAALMRRAQAFAALPIETLDNLALKTKLSDIGHSE